MVTGRQPHPERGREVRSLPERSNRLGADPRNTNYAGCNSSAKGRGVIRATRHRRIAWCFWRVRWFRFAVGGRPSYVPALRCASCRTSYGSLPASALSVVLPAVVLYAHFRSVGDVASARDVGFCAGTSTSTAPPAGRLREATDARRLAVWSVVGWWWLSPVGSFSSPGTGGDQ